MILRPYQERALESLRDEFGAGRRRVLLVAPTGSGKTVIACAMVRAALAKGRRVLYLAHRKELIDQPDEKLTALGVDHGIIMAGRPTRDSPVQVASVQTIARREVPPADLVIVDECFPAGTMVDGRPIETVRVGDSVSSLNHATGDVESRKVLRTLCSAPRDLVTIHFGGGLVTCTATHPIWNGRSYVAARDIRGGDQVWRTAEKVRQTEDVLGVRHGVRPPILEQRDDTDLLGGMQEGKAGRESEEGRDELRRVREESSALREEWSTPGYEQKGLLLRGMQDDVGIQGVGEVHGGHEQKIRLEEDARPQPDEALGGQREGESAPPGDGLAPHGARRQRARTDPDSTRHVGGVGLADGGVGPDRNAKGRRRLPDLLPSGHCEQGSQDRGRGRWPEPSLHQAQGGGPKEGCALEIARVDRVEVHERSGDIGFGDLCPGDQVFNLEVEGNNNYFANGVLVHNCHHVRASSWAAILEKLPGAAVVGLTATPWRLDGKGMAESFDAVSVAASPRDLVALGYLVPTTGFAYEAPELKSLKVKGGDFEPRGLSLAMQTKTIAGPLLSRWKYYAGELRTVVFCCSIEHSKATAEAFGSVAEHVDGTTPKADREAILARFRAGTTRVLCNVNVLTEGWDEPEVGCVVLARPTLSAALALQMIGRGRRTAPGKTCLRIHDHAGILARHGLPDWDRDYSLTADERVTKSSRPLESLRTCKECLAIYPASAACCPACGAVPKIKTPKLRVVDGVEVPLEEIKPQRAPPTRAIYDRLVARGKQNGWKPGWAAGAYKGMTGFWPPWSWRND